MRIGIAAMSSRLGRSGGVDVYTRSLVEALAEVGGAHRFVVLIHASAAADWADRRWPDHFEFKTLHDPASLSIGARVRLFLLRRLGLADPDPGGGAFLADQIDDLGLDLVHFPGSVIYPQSLATACVLTLFDLQQEYYPQFFTTSELAQRAKTYRSSVAKAVRVIVPTQFTRDTLLEAYQTAEAKISVIPAGITSGCRRVAAAEILRVRARYRLPEVFIYYPANPWQHKNHARLMAALRIYRGRYGESPWLVLSGRLPNEARDALSLAVAAGVEDRVLDLAFVASADVPALYSAATLMVFPSLFEGFGMPLVEAMACGCPIVAANATTIPEVTGGAALLFDPCDPDALAERLHEVLTAPQQRAALVEQGYRQLERFNWNHLVAQHHQVYAQAIREVRAVAGTTI